MICIEKTFFLITLACLISIQSTNLHATPEPISSLSTFDIKNTIANWYSMMPSINNLMPDLTSKWNLTFSFTSIWNSDDLKKIVAYPLAFLAAAYGIYRAIRSQKKEPTITTTIIAPEKQEPLPNIPLVPEETDEATKAKALEYITRWNYSEALTPGANDAGKRDKLLYAGMGSMLLIHKTLRELNRKRIFPDERKALMSLLTQAEKAFDYFTIERGDYKNLPDNISPHEIQTLETIGWQSKGGFFNDIPLMKHYTDDKLEKSGIDFTIKKKNNNFSKTDFWIYRIEDARLSSIISTIRSAHEACSLLDLWKKNSILFHNNQALEQATNIACKAATKEDPTAIEPYEEDAKEEAFHRQATEFYKERALQEMPNKAKTIPAAIIIKDVTNRQPLNL